jgi:uncharacterized protein (DUF2147 family)
MYPAIIVSFLIAVSAPAMAQMTPVGVWRSIDDKTEQPKAEIRISADANGVLTGVVEKALAPSAEPLCNLCTDERKGKPKLGMEIIRGAKKTEGSNEWEGGKILDPENGKEYSLRLAPLDSGKKLEVRGYIAFFYRNQTWIRVQ